MGAAVSTTVPFVIAQYVELFRAGTSLAPDAVFNGPPTVDYLGADFLAVGYNGQAPFVIGTADVSEMNGVALSEDYQIFCQLSHASMTESPGEQRDAVYTLWHQIRTVIQDNPRVNGALPQASAAPKVNQFNWMFEVLKDNRGTATQVNFAIRCEVIHL